MYCLDQKVVLFKVEASGVYVEYVQALGQTSEEQLKVFFVSEEPTDPW